MTAAIQHGMGEAEYRAMPGLSGTRVKAVLDSPADYRWDLDHPQPSTPAQALGTLVHALILGTYTAEAFPVSPFDSFRTAEARFWRDEQIALGYQVITEADLATAKAMRLAVEAHAEARELLTAPGSSEVTVTAEHNGAPMKGRIDRLPDVGALIDLKSARDVSHDAMERFIGDYSTSTQLAHYALIAGREEYRPLIIAVRNDRRPTVAVYRVGEMTWAVALDATRRAWDLYAECYTSGNWPDPHATGIADIELKPWAMDALDPVEEVELKL